MGKKTRKQKAIDYILDAMESICLNMTLTTDAEETKVNSIAMLYLSEAFRNIEGEKEGNETRIEN